jgi:hypothetical protein
MHLWPSVLRNMNFVYSDSVAQLYSCPGLWEGSLPCQVGSLELWFCNGFIKPFCLPFFSLCLFQLLTMGCSFRMKTRGQGFGWKRAGHWITTCCGMGYATGPDLFSHCFGPGTFVEATTVALFSSRASY